MTKAERETILRLDEDSAVLTVYTASPVMKRRLERRGYVFQTISPHSWQAEVPKKAFLLPRKLPLRSGKAPTRPFQPQNPVRTSGETETTS